MTNDLSAMLSKEDVAAAFRRLRKLQAGFGRKPNLNDVASAMIIACIEEGFDTRKRILGTLRTLGLNEMHVGNTLNRHDGAGAGECLWRIGAGGRYVIVDDHTAAGPAPAVDLSFADGGLVRAPGS